MLLGFTLLGLSGCATTSGESSAWAGPRQGEPAIAEVWRARCGQCHRRVEPATRTREHLEHALLRHRKRARLSDEEWRALIDFLAAPGIDGG
jgi:hypothetical protein